MARPGAPAARGSHPPFLIPVPLQGAPGVYQILCLPTGKVYIGSSVNVRSRCAAHARELSRKSHHNRHLQAAYNKHGASQFEFTALEYPPRPTIRTREIDWILEKQALDRSKGYNIVLRPFRRRRRPRRKPPPTTTPKGHRHGQRQSD